MEELMKKLDTKIEVISYEEIDGITNIHIKRTNKSAICSCCGKKSSKINAKYFRTIKNLPIQDNKVILNLETKTFFCKNKECQIKTFSEKFDFIESHSRITTRLKDMIVEDAKGMNAHYAKTTVNKGLVNISDDTILRLLKKQINISDNEQSQISKTKKKYEYKTKWDLIIEVKELKEKNIE